jgi:hypothetical protein
MVKRPGFVEEIVGEKEDDLDGNDEAQESFT